jgi:hypothetical protein
VHRWSKSLRNLFETSYCRHPELYEPFDACTQCHQNQWALSARTDEAYFGCRSFDLVANELDVATVLLEKRATFLQRSDDRAFDRLITRRQFDRWR